MFNSAPHELMVYEIVAMDEHVAESNDFAIVADARDSFRIVLGQGFHAFANNFKTALNRLAQDAIAVVVIERIITYRSSLLSER